MKWSRWLLGIILAIGVYSIFIIFSDGAILVQNLQKIKVEYIMLGVLVIFVGLILRAFRWHLMIKKLEVDIDWKPSMLIYFCGLAFALTPGKLGEVIKVHYLKRLVNAPVSKTAPTIIVERFFDIFAIMIIGLSSLLLIGIRNELVIISGFIAIAVFLILFYKKKYLIKFLERIQSIWLIGKISQKLIPSIDIVYILLKPKIFVKLALLTITAWLIESLVIYFVLKSFEIDIGVIKSMFINVISSLVGTASFLPGGIGGIEAGLLGFFLLEGISYDDAIGPILLIRIIVLWMTIIFGIIINRIVEMTILKNK